MDSSKYHLNTKYMKPSQQLASGPYEYLRSQISQQNYFNPRYIDKSPQNNMQQAMGQLKKLMAGQQQSLDRSKLAHIHSIKLHPIINQNFISSFDQNQYRLQPQDKVKIVKQKVFRIQNYYNYLYELQSQKEHKKLEQKTQNLLRQIKNDQQVSPKLKHNSPQKSYNIKQTDSVVGNYRQTNQEQQQDQGMHLAPEYSKYQQRNFQGQKYFLKEKDRKIVQQTMYKRF